MWDCSRTLISLVRAVAFGADEVCSRPVKNEPYQIYYLSRHRDGHLEGIVMCGQWGSSCFTAELVCIDVHCARWVQPWERTIRLLLSFSSHSSRTQTQAACGLKGLCRVHWENNTSACQAAQQLYPLCWMPWEIKIYDEVRSTTGFTFALCHNDWCQLTWEKLLPSDSKTCSTIDSWAWIQRCVVFCHPLLYWRLQRIYKVHEGLQLEMHSCSGFLKARRHIDNLWTT